MDDESLNETLDSTNETEVTVNDNEGTVADTGTEEPQFTEAERKAFKRAKKAEAEVKELREKLKALKPEAKPTNQPQPDLTDELKLIARGLSDEDIDQAKVIAKGRGISLPEALKDPLFTAYKSGKEEQAKRDGSRLGASHGSGQSTEEPLVKPGMSREEHEKLFKAALGK